MRLTISGSPADFDVPDFCPYCQKHSVFTALNGYRKADGTLRIILQCANSQCNEILVARYRYEVNRIYLLVQLIGGTTIVTQFGPTISKVSEDFVAIYNESEIAEQQRLMEICGVGFRKALEFLIKDYLIKKYTMDEEKIADIRKLMISPCINKYIDDPKIKKIAERATWLGNDETHYERRWIDKTLSDLKKLIELVVHYIEMETLFEETMESMPERKK